MADAKIIDADIEKLKARAERLRSDRGTLNSHLDEVREVIYPAAPRFSGTDTPGEKKMHRVYDSTGIVANQLLAASLHGMATNPAAKWFSLRMVDDDLMAADAVKEWLSTVEKKIYARMYAPGTNLVPAQAEFYMQLGAFGTAILFRGRTMKGGLLFQCRSLSECYVAENADGVIDTLFRFFPYTVRQCIEEWGAENVSEKVRDLNSKGKQDDIVTIVHAVYPRPFTGKKGKKHAPFASCYFELATCHGLEEGGFPDFPYVVARWEKSAGETYGRSCGMTALPDVKMLQIMMAETIRALQKMTNPVRYLRDDGVTGQIRSIPGATNYWRGNPNEGIMLEPTTDKLPLTLEEMDNLRNRIRTVFHNDTLQIVDDREMTLGEARMRRIERLRLQGPNVGRLASEFLAPLIDGVYADLERNGEIPEAPEEIDGKEVTVEFVSPLANAQKQEELGGLLQAFDYLAPLGDLGAKAISRKLNLDRTVDYLWDTLNIDPHLLNTDEEVQDSEAAEQQMQNAAQAPVIADAANKGAGAVKQLADANAGGGVDMKKLAGIVGQAAMQGQQGTPNGPA
jgi:hypothetical protein